MSLRSPWRALCVLALSTLVDCGACHGDVQHPQSGEPNTVAYCAHESSQESNCMACTAKPGCGFCSAAVSGAALCQPGVKDESTPSTCSVPLIIGSPDCPAPPLPE